MTNEALRQQFALLYQLQERDLEMLSIHQKLQIIPRQIEELQANVAQCETDLAAKSEELAETEKAQRAKNADLEMNAIQREKYRTDQRIVIAASNQEAYTTLEEQIEFLDKEDEEAEDAILVLMEESDRLKQELAELEAEVNQEKEKTSTETEQFQQELLTLEKQKEAKLNERKAFLPKIDKALRDKYHRWMKSQFESRSNAARAKTGFVALGRNGICSSCRIAIQPQTLKEAQKYEKPVYCSSCSRLLYVEPATPDIPFP